MLNEFNKIKKHTTYIYSFLGWCLSLIGFIDSDLDVILITRRHFDSWLWKVDSNWLLYKEWNGMYYYDFSYVLGLSKQMCF